MERRGRAGGTMDFQSLQIVWVALMCGLAAYTVIAYGVLAFGIIGASPVSTFVLRVAGTVAGAILWSGLIVRRKMIRAIDPQAPPAERLREYARASVLGLALVDAGGFLLVSLGIAAAAPMAPLVLGGAAIGVMALSGPKREHIGLDS